MGMCCCLSILQEVYLDGNTAKESGSSSQRWAVFGAGAGNLKGKLEREARGHTQGVGCGKDSKKEAD